MKNSIKLILTAVVLFGALSVHAQSSTKFGHINSLELLSFMPGVKAADAQLEEFAKKLEEKNTAYMQEYQTKIKQYQENEAEMMDAIKEVKLGEIADLEERITTFQKSAEEQLAAKREELIGPLLEQAQKAIEEVAKENGYSYVFDTSAGSVLYAEESDNIMPLVKKKLGL